MVVLLFGIIEQYDFEVDPYSNGLALLYLLNALPFIAITIFKRKRLESSLWLVYLTISASIVALAGAIWLDKSLINLFWALEAVMLLYIGYLYKSSKVRKEAFFLFVLAVVQTGEPVYNIFQNWPDLEFNWVTWYSVIGLAVVTNLFVILTDRMKVTLKNSELLLVTVYHEAACVISSLAILLPLFIFFEAWFFYPVVVLSGLLLLTNKYSKANFGKLALLGLFGWVLYDTSTDVIYTIKYDGWAEVFNQQTSIAFLGIPFVFLIIYLVHSKVKKDKTANLAIILNLALLYFVLDYVLVGYYFMQEYTANFALVVAVLYILLGKWLKNSIASTIGFLVFGLLFLAVFESMATSGAYHFAAQTLYAKIAMIEIAATMFLLQNLNTSYIKNPIYELPFALSRKLFYLLIPIVFLSGVRRNFPEYLDYAFWVSLIFPFVLYEITKTKSLVLEFYILLLGATYFAVLSQNVLVFLTALVIVFTIHFYKKGFTRKGYKHIKWGWLFTYNVYFVGLVIFLGSVNYLRDFSFAMAITSLYFLLILQFRKNVYPVRKHIGRPYFLGLGLIAAACGFVFYYTSSYSWLAGFTFLLVGAVLCWIAYSRKTMFIARHSENIWETNFIFVQAFLIFIYTSLIYAAFNAHFQTILTVTLVAHGIILLFHTINIKYTFASKIYIPLFIGVLLKLFFFDLKDLVLIQKVIVFIIVGVLLLVSSFLFLKLKDNLVKKQLDS